MPQIHQPRTMFHFIIEEVFETLETVGVYMSTAHYIIDPIVNRNFVNTFHHLSGPNQRQHFHKIQVSIINPDHIKDQGPHQFCT